MSSSPSTLWSRNFSDARRDAVRRHFPGITAATFDRVFLSEDANQADDQISKLGLSGWALFQLLAVEITSPALKSVDIGLLLLDISEHGARLLGMFLARSVLAAATAAGSAAGQQLRMRRGGAGRGPSGGRGGVSPSPQRGSTNSLAADNSPTPTASQSDNESLDITACQKIYLACFALAAVGGGSNQQQQQQQQQRNNNNNSAPTPPLLFSLEQIETAALQSSLLTHVRQVLHWAALSDASPIRGRYENLAQACQRHLSSHMQRGQHQQQQQQQHSSTSASTSSAFPKLSVEQKLDAAIDSRAPVQIVLDGGATTLRVQQVLKCELPGYCIVQTAARPPEMVMVQRITDVSGQVVRKQAGQFRARSLQGGEDDEESMVLPQQQQQGNYYPQQQQQQQQQQQFSTHRQFHQFAPEDSRDVSPRPPPPQQQQQHQQMHHDGRSAGRPPPMSSNGSRNNLDDDDEQQHYFPTGSSTSSSAAAPSTHPLVHHQHYQQYQQHHSASFAGPPPGLYHHHQQHHLSNHQHQHQHHHHHQLHHPAASYQKNPPLPQFVARGGGAGVGVGVGGGRSVMSSTDSSMVGVPPQLNSNNNSFTGNIMQHAHHAPQQLQNSDSGCEVISLDDFNARVAGRSGPPRLADFTPPVELQYATRQGAIRKFPAFLCCGAAHPDSCYCAVAASSANNGGDGSQRTLQRYHTGALQLARTTKSQAMKGVHEIAVWQCCGAVCARVDLTPQGFHVVPEQDTGCCCVNG